MCLVCLLQRSRPAAAAAAALLGKQQTRTWRQRQPVVYFVDAQKASFPVHDAKVASKGKHGSSCKLRSSTAEAGEGSSPQDRGCGGAENGKAAEINII